jgi:hypothetical protein
MKFDAIIVEGFLSQEECSDLITLVSGVEKWDEEGVDYWDGRILSDRTIAEEVSLEAAQKLTEIKKRIKQIIKDHYKIDNVYCETMVVTRWYDGMEQQPHADDMSNLEGPEWEWFRHRDFGSVIYLNNNYSGGHTYYPQYGVDVTPKVGTLVIHPANPDYLHGVTEISGETRYTIGSFWTKNEAYKSIEELAF